MALSPQEQGQPSPRETSATEVLTISNTTESVYTFISEAVDEGRAAMKRVIYESIISLGSNTIKLPVKERYTQAVIEQAGFEIDPEDSDGVGEDGAKRYTVIGSKNNLQHDYIFTSRDGSERASNMQHAQSLIQVFQIVSQSPLILEAMGKDKYFELVNEIARKSGTDLKLEVPAGEDNKLAGPNQETEQVMQSMANVIEQNATEIQSIKEALGGGGEQDPQSRTMLERQAAEEQAAAEQMAAEMQQQPQPMM